MINMQATTFPLFIDIFASLGVSTPKAAWILSTIALSELLLLAFVAYFVLRFVLQFKIVRLILRSKNKWDDSLVSSGVFDRLAHAAPAILLYSLHPYYFDVSSSLFKALYLVSVVYLLIGAWRVLSAILSAVEDIYSRSSFAKKAPITGFIQVTRLLVTLAIIFLSLSLLLGKSPVYLLSGLTAVAAVLLLIFRDTILGFVAGIQITANRMFNTGDWIEIPKYNVDGEILLIGLNVVKVQNWDKTISTIPTYALASDAVKNWRGMTESGGRRIKRAIQIDMRSIRFATSEDCQHWQKFKLIREYLTRKLSDIDVFNSSHTSGPDDVLNARRLTNIGTFRAYIAAYLAQHPDINQDMTVMVRQLKPSELGLSLEVYCFCKRKEWVIYEGIQADIFDHILAVMPAFGLRAYQRVTNEGGETQTSAKGV